MFLIFSLYILCKSFFDMEILTFSAPTVRYLPTPTLGHPQKRDAPPSPWQLLPPAIHHGHARAMQAIQPAVPLPIFRKRTEYRAVVAPLVDNHKATRHLGEHDRLDAREPDARQDFPGVSQQQLLILHAHPQTHGVAVHNVESHDDWVARWWRAAAHV